MKSKKNRIFGILFGLALMLGMMGALSATAYAGEYNITTSVSPNGSGSISVKADGAEVTSAGEGAAVTLTATPEEGYHLSSITAAATQDVYDDISASADTVKGQFFQVSGSNAQSGWQLNNDRAITISSLTGDNLSMVTLTVAGNGSERSPEVDHGDVQTYDDAVIIDKINSSSVTITAPDATEPSQSWSFSSAKVLGSGKVEVDLRDTDDPNEKVFTMSRGPVQVAAEFENGYPLWVGGVQVTSTTNSGKNWDYNPDTKTLSLYGEIIGSGELDYAGVEFDCGIYSNIPDLTIYVKNDSIVRGSGIKGYSYGIMGNKSLKITGPGTLIAAGGSGNDPSGAYGYTYGILADSITLDGKLEARGGRSQRGYASIGVETGEIKGNGELTASGYHTGISSIAGGITIEGVTVTAESNKYGIILTRSLDSDSTITIKKGSNVTASGVEAGISGKVKNEIAGKGWSDTSGTEGETDIAINESGQEFNFLKVQFPVHVKYDLWVGKTQVTSTNAADVLKDGKVSFTPSSDGLSGTLTLKGANISGDNGNYTSDEVYTGRKAAIRTKLRNLTINVTADSTVSGPSGIDDYSFGIDAIDTNLTISGDGTLNAIGGGNGSYNYGVYAENLYVNGRLSAIGNEPAPFYVERNAHGDGVYVNTGITINEGAELTAKAAGSNGKAIIYNGDATLKNAVPGTGWTNAEGTEGKTSIAINKTGQALSSLDTFKKVQFPEVVDIEPTTPTKPTTPTTSTTSTVSGVLIAKATAKGKTGMVISWNKVRGAKGYDVYFVKCNGKDGMKGMKKVKTVKAGRTLKWTKTGLRKKTAYKACVKAYTVKNGKKKYIKTSPMSHAYTSGASKKYSNAKILTVNKTKVTLKKGKGFKIKAKITKVKKNKKLMPKKHVKTVRYMTSNKKVATVSAGGKITAKGKGTCTVVAFAHNGVSKKIKVTVK